jgi:hypothetical protein
MRILFILDKRVNAGSIHAVAHYLRAGEELGHTIALYGRPDPAFPSLRFCTDLDAFEHVVFIIEASARWLPRLQLAHILGAVPRSGRTVVDTDGMFNPMIVVDGYDRNHASERDRLEWLAYHEALADRIIQTTTKPQQSGVKALPFFGYDPKSEISPKASPPKRYDIVHVGHNWWRWYDVSRCLLPAIEQIRGRVGDICLVGSWWDGAPPWAADLGLEAAFRVDRAWLERLRIQVKPAVPYTEVIPTMSQGRVNIMSQRPVLRHLKILTSKYFEILCADAIPLVMLDPDHAESIYGHAGRELTLQGGVGDKLLDALSRPAKYREIVHEVRRHLMTYHSYRRRVDELVAALRN